MGGRLRFWSSSIWVVFHFGCLPFWSSSFFGSGRLHFLGQVIFTFWVRSSSLFGSHGILTWDGHMGCSHGMVTWDGHIGMEWSHGMVKWDCHIYSIQICCRAVWKVGRILGRMVESDFPISLFVRRFAISSNHLLVIRHF